MKCLARQIRPPELKRPRAAVPGAFAAQSRLTQRLPQTFTAHRKVSSGAHSLRRRQAASVLPAVLARAGLVRLRRALCVTAQAATGDAAQSGGDFEVPPEQAEFLQQQPPTEDAASAATDAADDAATPAAEAEPDDPAAVTALGLLRGAWRVLRCRLAAVLVLMSLQDAAIFGCQRLADFATNHAAITFLRGPYTREAVGRMAWPIADRTLHTFDGGYMYVRWAVQGASLPLKLAVQAAAAAALFHLATSGPRAGQGRNPFKRLGAAVADAFAALRVGLSDWRRAYLATALVLLRFLPLGAASCLVIPLYWTLPQLVALQTAVPAAVAEGLGPKAAVARSQRLLAGHTRAVAIPLLLLMLAPRVVLTGRNWLLSALPPHIWTQVQELPYLIACGTPLLAILLFRLQELLPIVVYKVALKAEEADGTSQQLGRNELGAAAGPNGNPPAADGKTSSSP